MCYFKYTYIIKNGRYESCSHVIGNAFFVIFVRILSIISLILLVLLLLRGTHNMLDSTYNPNWNNNHFI